MKFWTRAISRLHFAGFNILPGIAKLILAMFLLTGFSSSVVRAQQRTTKIDHLTTAEDDLIHDAQELDKRTEIFVKAIDRRLTILNPDNEIKTAVKTGKETRKKDFDKWGEPPSGTRAELLGDIKNILDEAARNIDNAAEHNAKNSLLPKALKKLADGCSRFTPQLKPFYDSAQSERERADVYDAMENCREIIQANTTHDAGGEAAPTTK